MGGRSARIKAGGEWHPMSVEEGPGERHRVSKYPAEEHLTPPTPSQCAAEEGPGEFHKIPISPAEGDSTPPTQIQCRATNREGSREERRTPSPAYHTGSLQEGKPSLLPYHQIQVSMIDPLGVFSLSRRFIFPRNWFTAGPNVNFSGSA